jgi:ankyrin repeat protein
MTEAYKQALGAMDAGDVEGLRRVLAAHPEVVRESEAEHEGVYCGYFAHATLLHHVAGNPGRGPLPGNIVEIARTLIAAGADVGARCGGGPAQPDTGEGDVMGLVASSAQMADSGLYRPMIDLLLASGYSFAEDRGTLAVCLYHTVECQRQREVGEYLAAKGAKVDLVFAAALGRTDLVQAFVDPSGALTPDAHGPFRKDAAERRAAGDAAIKQEALTWACMNGRDAVVRPLLDLGADLNGKAVVARMDITPLHGAAWAGWEKTCAFLLALGADFTIVDHVYNNTPIGLAAYCRRQRVVDLFRVTCAGRLSLEDLIAIGDLAEIEAAIAGLDVNAAPPGSSGRPGVILRDAAVYGRADVVKLLLARGADRTLRNPSGQTAYDLAVSRRFQEIVALLEPDPATGVTRR